MRRIEREGDTERDREMRRGRDRERCGEERAGERQREMLRGRETERDADTHTDDTRHTHTHSTHTHTHTQEGGGGEGRALLSEVMFGTGTCTHVRHSQSIILCEALTVSGRLAGWRAGTTGAQWLALTRVG